MTPRKENTAGKAVKYEVLTAIDRLAIAREYLRSREDEHFRRALATPPDGDTTGLDQIADAIKRIQDEVVGPLEDEVAKASAA